MKSVLLATVILLPCLLAFSESGSIIPNIVGILYIALLSFLSRTKRGCSVAKRIYKDLIKTNDDIFKNN